MEKRGAGHVEMVIAYVLFIGFVIFVFYFFNPIKTSKLADSSLPLLFDAVGKNISMDIKTYSVLIKTPETLEEEDVVYVDISSDELEGKQVRVENYSDDGMPYPSDVVSRGDKSRISFNPGGEKFVLIKIADKIAGSSLPAGYQAEDSETEVSYVGKRSVYSEERAGELAEAYDKDYLGLKKDLNLKNADFAFEIVFQDGRNINGTRFIPAGLEVYSDSKRREMVTGDGSIDFANLNVRVW